MKLIEVIRNDKEIQKLKAEYKELHGKNAPPYNYDEYNGVDDYKEKLKKLIKHHKK